MVNLLSFKNPIEPWLGVEIKTTTAEATNQFDTDAVVPMVLRLGVWPSIRMKAQGTGSGKSNLEGFVTANGGWTQVNVNRFPSRRAVFGTSELAGLHARDGIQGRRAANARVTRCARRSRREALAGILADRLDT